MTAQRPPMESHAHLAAMVDDLRREALTPENRDRLAEMLGRAVAGVDAAEALGIKRKPGQRTWQTGEALVERDHLLREAAAQFLTGLSVAGQARRLHLEWSRYHAGAWQRERVLERCPDRHVGTVRELLWRVLKLHDRVLSARTLRLMLARS